MEVGSRAPWCCTVEADRLVCWQQVLRAEMWLFSVHSIQSLQQTSVFQTLQSAAAAALRGGNHIHSARGPMGPRAGAWQGHYRMQLRLKGVQGLWRFFLVLRIKLEAHMLVFCRLTADWSWFSLSHTAGPDRSTAGRFMTHLHPPKALTPSCFYLRSCFPPTFQAARVFKDAFFTFLVWFYLGADKWIIWILYHSRSVFGHTSLSQACINMQHLWIFSEYSRRRVPADCF